MKKVTLILTAILLTSSAVFGQTDDFFVGTAVSIHNEIYLERASNGFEIYEKNAVAQSFAAGVRMQKKLKGDWGLNFGLNYMERAYETLVLYNHCYLTFQSEFPCDTRARYLDKYGYKTIEIPLGVNKYLVTKEKWELYINVNAVTAYDFHSFYNPSSQETETITHNKINFSSSSLTSSAGLAYNLTNKLKINFEPFIRLIHLQRTDPALRNNDIIKWTHFDNFGGHFLVLYRL